MTGMIEECFGFIIYDFGICLGRKTWKEFFVWLDLSNDIWGSSKQSEDS